MNVYLLLVFVHVLGAVGIFAALAVEAVSLRSLRVAISPAEARSSMQSFPARMGPIAMLATLVSGMWMMARSWGPEPWLVGAFVGLVTMGVLGGAVSQRRFRRLGVSLASERGAELSGTFRSWRASRALTASLRMRIAIGVGILGLMTIKPPDRLTASLMLAAAVLAGLLASALSRRGPPQTWPETSVSPPLTSGAQP